ncbi:hypothetical protein JAAARDRAFT_162017 [Jaapia argillacea MUCL 33604]|uniref:Uncharacterized protein n=1 Tax=Jaapia argillacea MUCL 33604 TaxID=933084 RepID=A0A067PEE2_9AGAM|nr:hypothetical protein JAAARDRAFT_162017 [Jaapia argillacea MUCL 33604]
MARPGPPYLLIPQTTPFVHASNQQRRRPSFPIGPHAFSGGTGTGSSPPGAGPSHSTNTSPHLAHQSIPGQSHGSPTLGHIPPSSPTYPPQTLPFKAPAHRHAHHLHSIPPREKSTRTLIIDHILWVHARTRFAEARAELGMTDRTGGPSHPNYVFRERPENYDEGEEAESDGEEVDVLKVRDGDGSSMGNLEEMMRLRKQRQDLAFAKSLKLRSEGLEKTVTSMLDQPPPVHPFPSTSSSSSSLFPPSEPKPRTRASHPHTLPNGVRLRLALATLYNDLFSRGPPQSSGPSAMSNGLPLAILPLSLISTGSMDQGQGGDMWNLGNSYPPSQPSHHTLTLYSSGISFSSSHPQHQQHHHQHTHSHPHSQHSNSHHPHHAHSNSYPQQHNQPQHQSNQNQGQKQQLSPSRRCARHLYLDCSICHELRDRSNTTRFGFAPGLSCSFVRAEWKGRHVSPNAASTSTTSPVSSSYHNGSKTRDGVGGSADGHGGIDARDEGLAEFIVRFVRLSALVALELGREVGHIGVDEDSGDEGDGDEGQAQSPKEGGNTPRIGGYSPPQTRSPNLGTTGLFARQNQSNNNNRFSSASSTTSSSTTTPPNPLLPTREWYMLLAGLLTRAVLEGYLMRGWVGVKGVECLFGVGLGAGSQQLHQIQNQTQAQRNGKGYAADDEEEEDGEMRFEPDDLPELEQAARILFPSNFRVGGGGDEIKTEAEIEYEKEIRDRMRRFLDIPQSCHDLSAHLEDLASRYPSEPVERAALRYYEAVAKWRGKPELEVSKTRPPRAQPTSPSSLAMESYLRSNPTSPEAPSASNDPNATSPASSSGRSKRQPIEKYYTLPITGFGYGGSGRRKRGREGSLSVGSGDGGGKRGRGEGVYMG